jgi:hypothetical protein
VLLCRPLARTGLSQRDKHYLQHRRDAPVEQPDRKFFSIFRWPWATLTGTFQATTAGISVACLGVAEWFALAL